MTLGAVGTLPYDLHVLDLMGHLILVPAWAAAEVCGPSCWVDSWGVLVPGCEVRTQLGTWLAKSKRPRGVSSVHHTEHHNTHSERNGLPGSLSSAEMKGHASGARERKELQAGGV